MLVRLIRLDGRLSARLRAIEAASSPGRPLDLAIRLFAHSGDAALVFPALAAAWLVASLLDFGLGGGGSGGVWPSASIHGLQSASGVAFASAVLAGALGSAVAGLGKAMFGRRRPDGDWGAGARRRDPHSFPSGHAARTMAIAAAAGIASGPGLAAALALWSLSVGLSRVSLGVHWCLDVIAGWLLGAIAGMAGALTVFYLYAR